MCAAPRSSRTARSAPASGRSRRCCYLPNLRNQQPTQKPLLGDNAEPAPTKLPFIIRQPHHPQPGQHPKRQVKSPHHQPRRPPQPPARHAKLRNHPRRSRRQPGRHPPHQSPHFLLLQAIEKEVRHHQIRPIPRLKHSCIPAKGRQSRPKPTTTPLQQPQHLRAQIYRLHPHRGIPPHHPSRKPTIAIP